MVESAAGSLLDSRLSIRQRLDFTRVRARADLWIIRERHLQQHGLLNRLRIASALRQCSVSTGNLPRKTLRRPNEFRYPRAARRCLTRPVPRLRPPKATGGALLYGARCPVCGRHHGKLIISTGKRHTVFCPQPGNDGRVLHRAVATVHAHAGEREPVGWCVPVQTSQHRARHEPPLTDNVSDRRHFGQYRRMRE